MKSEEFYRQEMIKIQIAGRGIRDKRVLDVMGRIPRHRFISGYSLKEAYSDKPLPIDYNQTISQPYIVALMCELCCLKGDEKVLEIGTGSGYQTAILSYLAGEVYTIERLGSLSSSAKLIVEQLGAGNVRFIYGDGYEGVPSASPFDAIIVSAAPEFVPGALKAQLSEGGHLIIPVGREGTSQKLMIIVKRESFFEESTEGRVIFVPMRKGYE
ncbi:MAG: protein-L-isoaspartate(D-aspartate) O-methyltransferase [Spirochaetales bacterium]|nr:protein-L-isoaspartate(D-aspartate) O-methyltransferase [Spirochaetales bacterium]